MSKKKEKKERTLFAFTSFLKKVYTIMNYFFFFMIDEATPYARCQSYKKH